MKNDKLTIIGGVVHVLFSDGCVFPWVKPYEQGVFAAAEKWHKNNCKKQALIHR